VRARADVTDDPHTKENTMKALLGRLVREDDGQDLIEYALLAAFIALAATVAMTALGGSISGFFQSVKTKLDDAATP
jgi:pilus assembly protein Flp/PilA